MQNENPLGSAQVSKLMFKFAIPSIVGMLVGSLYILWTNCLSDMR